MPARRRSSWNVIQGVGTSIATPIRWPARSANRNAGFGARPTSTNGSPETTWPKHTSGQARSASWCSMTRIGPPQDTSARPSSRAAAVWAVAGEVSIRTSAPARAQSPRSAAR